MKSTGNRILVLFCLGFLITGGLYAQESVGEVYTKVETKAQYPGGAKAFAEFLQENLKYPEEAIKEEIMGKVYLQMIINKDGSVSEVVVTKKVHPLLDAEATRLVKMMPKWVPATLDGEAVRTKVSVPISFRLN